MISEKKSIQLLLESLSFYKIRHVVLCSGSRNSPLIHSFVQDPRFQCYFVADERSAGFFALGLILNLDEPVAVCCTSGTAVLNIAPAAAEAFYAEQPLLIISADRPLAWIGQMDGQTLYQEGVLGRLVKKSVNLPEIFDGDDNAEWFCNRLISEALHRLWHHGPGPVHINVPISEPLFGFVQSPVVHAKPVAFEDLEYPPKNGKWLELWRNSIRRLIIVGQMQYSAEVSEWLQELAESGECVVLAEYLANLQGVDAIGNFDAVLESANPTDLEKLKPDFVLYFGGHIVSKRLKNFLRKNPCNQLIIRENGEVVDLFCSLTSVLEGKPQAYLWELVNQSEFSQSSDSKEFVNDWKAFSRKVTAFSAAYTFPYSDLFAVRSVMANIPEKSYLHLGNSCSVRNAQLFPLPSGTRVYCNRGTNGIEGTLSTAVGFASILKPSDSQVFVILGDLSFFYDMNALWNRQLSPNLRILLINNGGGGIFHKINGLKNVSSLSEFIFGKHKMSAKGWAESVGCTYLSAGNISEFDSHLERFTGNQQKSKPILFEVFTDSKLSASIQEEFYRQLKLGVTNEERVENDSKI